MRLSLVSGVGPLLRRKLIQHFGTYQAVLDASIRDLTSVDGVGSKVAQAIAMASHIDVEQEMEICRANGISIITEEEAPYPNLLRELHDPPSPIYVQGELVAQDAMALAIVGTRHATSYGKRQARRLGTSLAQAGFTIVSGLARGIDTESHRAALDAGGRTIAVLAGGLLNVFPTENESLARQITEQGALVSEVAPRVQPAKGAFPRRNRIITGICLGVIVVEASYRSGALISARHAMEQGREVFAVPGPADSRASHGCHQLIRDGARLVETATDVLEELGPLVGPLSNADGSTIRHPAELQLNAQEKAVLKCIGTEATSIDQIAEDSRLPVHRVLSTVSVLEMRRLVSRVSGNSLMRL